MKYLDLINYFESKSSKLQNRGLICGFGINDAKFATSTDFKGKTLEHPAYKKWKGMIERIHGNKNIKKNQCYSECSISTEWALFSNFYDWWSKCHSDGYVIDKDILKYDNTVYCKEFCIMIPQWVNNILIFKSPTMYDLPIGVSFSKKYQKISSCVRYRGKQYFLGYFPTASEAHKAYVARKIDLIESDKRELNSIYNDLSDHLIATFLQQCARQAANQPIKTPAQKLAVEF